MKKSILSKIFWSLFTVTSLFFNKIYTENHAYSIIFVHLGNSLPDYLSITVEQTRLFNKNTKIFVILNDVCLDFNSTLIQKLNDLKVEFVTCEQLKPSESHKKFMERFVALGIDGYHRYTKERFFYIDELIEQYELSNVFHVESDVMLYFDLSQYINLFHDYYPGIAVPFQNDTLASVSFIYFSGTQISRDFCIYMAKKLQSPRLEPDMVIFASYKNQKTDREIDHLPTVPHEYQWITSLKSPRGDVSGRAWKYWNHIEEWNSIFDMDNLGEFLIYRNWVFNKQLFDPEYFYFRWEFDAEGRKVPYIYSDNDFKYRINTLHIYSKKFDGVGSLDQIMLPSIEGCRWTGQKWVLP